MDKQGYYLTPEGQAKLKAQLEELRGPRRTALAKRLRAAVQQGDLSENADYIAAKEEQAFLEGRIQELEIVLRNATLIEEGASGDEVAIGSTVVVASDGQPAETYQLVGIKEADPRNGRISHESPIGKALLGHRVGEIARAETPAGVIEFKIIKIR
jgi:transcription elongation factor GreA